MSAVALQVLSQGLAIVDGKNVLHGTATDRVPRIVDAIRSYGPLRVGLERGIYFMESFKAAEGKRLVLRWAEALKNSPAKISVAILDDELILTNRSMSWNKRSC